MRVTMFVPARSVPCNLRRIAAYVTCRNKMRTKIARQGDGSNLLSASCLSSPSIAACRVYGTESDSEPRVSLPALVDGAEMFNPSFIFPFRFVFLSFFQIPRIDKEFVLSETLLGTKYAITVISKALANKDYDSLEGLVAEDMIEVLRTKIETLSSRQRWLIAVNEDDIVFNVLSDIAVTTDEEHSIEIKTICHYIPEKAKKQERLQTMTDTLELEDLVMCNYTFTRKYVNNIGGPWIATFVNHFSINKYIK